jgi:hypothetical protein
MSATLEDAKSIDIGEWKTLNTAASPTKLDIGQSPDCLNTWTDEKPGSVITAPGYEKVGTSPSGNPCSFTINYFKASSGTQTFVISDNETVWTTVDFINFTSIITGLNSAYQLRGLVIRDKLWLTNGSDDVRTFDGSTVVVLNGDGTTPDVPLGRFIAYHDERVWLYNVPDEMSNAYFSALTDASGNIIDPDDEDAWPASNFLAISDGDADFGTGMLLYRGYLHFFKQFSIWRLVGYDEYTYSRVKTRASVGTRLPESIREGDSLVYFVGLDGIYAFDGEDTTRISDIIDPTSAESASFGFGSIQQVNSLNGSWAVSDSPEFNGGTVPTNIAVSDALTMVATDSSQADFVAGATKTNIDTLTATGSIQLDHSDSGVSATNVLSGEETSSALIGSVAEVGTASMVTDGDLTNIFGGNFYKSDASLTYHISLTVSRKFKRIIFKGYRTPAPNYRVVSFHNGTGYQVPTSATFGTPAYGTSWLLPPLLSANDIVFEFDPFLATDLYIAFRGYEGNAVMAEIEGYETAFYSTGKFTSKTLDLGLAPASLGNFNADVTLNSQTITYFTQSSANGTDWDAEVACTNGGAIGSTARQYLRWGANFASDGSNTPVISAAYLPGIYLSVIHHISDTLSAWGIFEAVKSNAGQTINFYYRGATTSGGVSAASWNAISSGSPLSIDITYVYVQFKIEILGGDATHLPSVSSVTINWIISLGEGTAQATQNVASWFWKNRYWLSAATNRSSVNDIIIILGKKTYNNPWQLKDWGILSFCRFHDYLYGTSSADGSIYKLDSGYSKDGAAMDSHFETGDFTFGGFQADVQEALIEIERMGPYNLIFGVSADRGTTWTEYNIDLTVTSGPPSYWKRLNIGTGKVDRVRFRVRTAGPDQPFEVHNLRVWYKLAQMRGSYN